MALLKSYIYRDGETNQSLGTGSVIRPGDGQDGQRMSAGTGIRHSEFNHSQSDPVRFPQIWILPECRGLPLGYEQKSFEPDAVRDQLKLVASRDGRDGSVTVHQDVALYLAELSAGKSAQLDIAKGRHAWVQLATGAAALNGMALREGDGAAVSDEARLELKATGDAEVLVFDLA